MTLYGTPSVPSKATIRHTNYLNDDEYIQLSRPSAARVCPFPLHISILHNNQI